jgi:transposase
MLTLEAWVDIKAMHRQGRSIRSIAKELGISRNTVRRYLRDEKPPHYAARPKRPSILEPHKDYLTKRIEEKPEIHATVLLRELRERGYTGQITLVKDFIRPLRAERRRLEELTVRFETAPGDQLQVDWSEFGRLPDGRKLYALAPVLGWSRTLFVYFTTRMVVQELLYGLVQSFEYFGGVPRTLLFDNPKTVVLRRGETVEDSTLHPRFLDFLGHYGLTLRLCKVRRAQTKGKVERPMEYIWTSLVYPNLGRYQAPAEWNRAARHWLDTVANVRIHGTTRERPFDRLPKEGLVPLASVRPYDLTWTEPRKVHKDCHFSFEGNRYSVPWQHGSAAVLVRRYPEERIEVERAGEVIAHHRLRAGKGQTITLPEHVAGLWQRTLAKPAPTATPERSALAATAPAWALPEVEVEMRDLSVYEQVAVGAHAPMLTEVAR